MGAGSSKPAASADSHVFSSSSPVQFSANFVDALQSNTETDSARARSLELQIQARVSEELERLRAREQQTLAEIEKKLAEVRDSSPSPAGPLTTSTNGASSSSYYPPGSLDLDAPRIPFAGRESLPMPVEAVQQQQQSTPINRELSRETVNSEIEELRAKLEGRKKLIELDAGIEKARSEVVSCLRLHDRRPLDCWKEVETFKKEVARLEEGFVDRIVG
ncbi:Mic19 family protein [Aspergillus ibericus CBS 121593]|uniref:Altered inheritance of mitochondria protein 13, mitochondrial n=1 Tax=Aspergillus ibericus CBS 121593 TaxID=1448316 RepID=A0A395GMI3_9EURO|nr:altered inheritance of mitochondria protein 13, mitochondrial [Aspergillus ibericus CBS 121593]RAK96720.1 altered inheritance of mitochondria protein 13, mitochondrial [Aspergillus ibericus CBS 121593]